MSNLSFQPVGGYWSVTLAAVVLFALLSVRPLIRRTTRRQRFVLAVLRGLVSALVLIAMLRPEVVYTDMQKQTATLAVLVDQSRSLQVADGVGGRARWEMLQMQLASSRDAVAALSEDVNLRVYGFDRQLTPLEVESGNIVTVPIPEGSQTAIGAALAEVVRREAAGRLLAVVLLSDGAQRAFAPYDLAPQQATRQLATLGVPLYAVAFGSAGSAGDSPDLSVADLVASETVFAEAPTEVTAQLNVRGYSGQTVRAQLQWEDETGEMQVVDTRLVEVNLDRFGRQKQAITFRHTPTAQGEQKITVYAVPQEGEQVTRNNEQSTFVTVRKGGVNVLLLHGSQRRGGAASGSERRAIKWALDASPDIMLTDMLIQYTSGTEDALADRFQVGDPDVVLLLNVDVAGMSREVWQQLADWVDTGGGLGMLGGYHSFGPGGFANSPLAGLLPVNMRPLDRNQLDEPIRQDVHLAGELQITPARLASGHWIMNLGDEKPASEAWVELPPLLGANSWQPHQIKANGIVLAEADNHERNPLLVVVPEYGRGRVLAFAGDTTGRWRRFGHGDALKRFWRQAVLWLARKDQSEEGEVWLRLDQRRVLPGSEITFAVGANTPEGEPVDSPQFEVAVETPDGEQVIIDIQRDGQQFLGTLRDTSAEGDYLIRVSATQNGETIGTTTGRFLVIDHDVELDNPIADVDLMAGLAEMTADAGGMALAPEELPSLFERLANKTVELEEPIVRRVTLWDNWPIFLAFVGLLGTEWFLRKKWGLV